ARRAHAGSQRRRALRGHRERHPPERHARVGRAAGRHGQRRQLGAGGLHPPPAEARPRRDQENGDDEPQVRRGEARGTRGRGIPPRRTPDTPLRGARTMQFMRYMAVIAALAIPAGAFAHGGGPHVMGTVRAIDATRLTVETTDKKDVKVLVDDKTKFEKAGASASAKVLSVGDRVVVHTATKPGTTELVAILVKIGASDSRVQPSPRCHPSHVDPGEKRAAQAAMLRLVGRPESGGEGGLERTFYEKAKNVLEVPIGVEPMMEVLQGSQVDH